MGKERSYRQIGRGSGIESLRLEIAVELEEERKGVVGLGGQAPHQRRGVAAHALRGLEAVFAHDVTVRERREKIEIDERRGPFRRMALPPARGDAGDADGEDILIARRVLL